MAFFGAGVKCVKNNSQGSSFQVTLEDTSGGCLPALFQHKKNVFLQNIAAHNHSSLYHLRCN